MSNLDVAGATEQAAPDLSSLDKDTRLCVALELEAGATWEAGPGAWALWSASSILLATVWADGQYVYSGPAYLTDPAAWGPLLLELDGATRERDSEEERPWVCWWWVRSEMIGAVERYGPFAQTSPVPSASPRWPVVA